MLKSEVRLGLMILLSVGILMGCVDSKKEMAPGDDTPIHEQDNIKDDERDIKGEDGTYLGTVTLNHL